MPQETKKTLIVSIGEIQHDLSLYLEKNQTMQMNGRTIYNYFGEAQVLELVKKEFKKHHITYIWSYVKDTLKVINDIPYFEMELTLCKETEEIKTYWPFTGKNTDPAKSIGSALTYGVKYVLSKLLGLPTEELDPDNSEISKINSKQEKEQTEIINNSNPNWMSEQHFNNIKNFITNTKIEQDIISKGKNWLKEELNVEKLSPVLIRKQSEDFYYQFKERFLR
ncbi:ERF family protein [Spiroplasma endosymbiont of Seladonia tumulorum]|uniref:ERF family protein n=2 Tax=unclassified Spiroplasma TaxID=2637901 RepID=UPI0030D00AAC